MKLTKAGGDEQPPAPSVIGSNPVCPACGHSTIEPLLDSREVAAILRKHVNTVLQLVRDGKLRRVGRNPKRFLFDPADVRAYIESEKSGDPYADAPTWRE